jgi:hypothetical protein
MRFTVVDSHQQCYSTGDVVLSADTSKRDANMLGSVLEAIDQWCCYSKHKEIAFIHRRVDKSKFIAGRQELRRYGSY